MAGLVGWLVGTLQPISLSGSLALVLGYEDVD